MRYTWVMTTFLTGVHLSSGDSPFLLNPLARLTPSMVLLPRDPHVGVRVSVLEGEEGCFEWSTDRPDLVSLELDTKTPSNCVRSVWVTMTSTAVADDSNTDNMTGTVIAQSPSELSVRTCEISIASLHHVQITTIKRKLSIGDEDELRVVGFDALGNTFNSLEGMQFQWAVFSEGDHQSALILDAKNNMVMKSTSDLIRIVGHYPGESSISVEWHSTEDSGKSIQSEKVQVVVFERFHLTSVLVGLPFCGKSTVDVVNREGKVSTDSSLYRYTLPSVVGTDLRIDDHTVVSVSAARPVQTLMTVSDVRTSDNEKIARLCVGRPSEVVVEPSTFFPVSGEPTVITVRVTSKDCPHIGALALDSAELELTVEGRDFSVVRKSADIWIVTGVVPGKSVRLVASLSRVGSEHGGCVWTPEQLLISASVELKSVFPVSVSEEKVVVLGTQKGFSVTPSGGSGSLEVVAEEESACKFLVAQKIFFQDCSSGKSTTYTVRDKFNKLNAAQLQVHVVDGTDPTTLHLGSPVSSLNAYLGFEKPVDQLITATVVVSGETFPLYNCSSLVESVRVEDAHIASVEWVVDESFAGACGQVKIFARKSGTTNLHAVQKNGPPLSVPLHVHSPFEIVPVGTTVVGINGTAVFEVTGGGSLANLKQLFILDTSIAPNALSDSPVVLSHPWIAEAVVNTTSSQVSVTCKLEGRSSLQILHANTERTFVECVVPEIVGIGREGHSVDLSSNLIYVTCGHEDPHLLKLFAFDDKKRRIDVVRYNRIEWEGTVLGGVHDDSVSIPPLACDAETSVSVVAVLSNEQILRAHATVRARDTVRSTLGPAIASRPVYVPCGEGVLQYVLGFEGGSGEYAVVGGESVFGGGIPSGDAKILGSLAPSSYPVHATVRGCGQGARDNAFEVRDVRLEGSFEEIAIRAVLVKKISVTVPAVVVTGQWTVPVIEVVFEDGARFNSRDHKKWFWATRFVWQWIVTLGQSIKAETETDELGVFRFRFTEGIKNESTNLINKFSLQLSSPTLDKVPQAIASVVLIATPTFAEHPRLAWRIVPGSVHELQVAHVPDAVDARTHGIKYTFGAKEGLRVEQYEDLPGIVAVTALERVESGIASEITLSVVNAQDTSEVYFSVNHGVTVAVPTGITINGGEEELVLVSGGLDDYQVSLNFENFYPPAEMGHYCSTEQYRQVKEELVEIAVLAACKFGKSVEKKFSVTQNFYVNPMPKILPYKNLPTADSPHQQLVELSPAEIGLVTHNNFQFAHLRDMKKVFLVVGGQEVRVPVLFRDVRGLEFTETNFAVHAGSGSPRIAATTTAIENGKVSLLIAGKSVGCTSVFGYLEEKLIGSVEACVEWPLLPIASASGPLVLLPGSTVEMHLAEQEPTKGVFESIGTVESMSRMEELIEIVNSTFQGFAFPARSVEWAVPPDQQLVSIQEQSAGKAMLSVSHSVSGPSSVVLSVGSVRVPLMISSVAALRPIVPTTVLVHAQNTEYLIAGVPVTAEGQLFTQSPFIKRPFIPHSCEFVHPELDSAYWFLEEGISPFSCALKPRVFEFDVTGQNIPKTVQVKIVIPLNGVSAVAKYSVEPHFHILVGSADSGWFPVPSVLKNVIASSVQLRVINSVKGGMSADCRCSVFSDSGVRAVFLADSGVCTVTRPALTSGGAPVQGRVTVTCGDSQQVSTDIHFLTPHTVSSPNHLEGPTSPVTDVLYSIGWWLGEWTLKVIASLLVLTGVAVLFQRRRQEPLLESRKMFRTNLTLSSNFKPIPHPDKDTFIGQ